MRKTFLVIELMRSNLTGSNIVVILYLNYQDGLRIFILNVVISGDFFFFLSKKCYVIASGWFCLKQNQGTKRSDHFSLLYVSFQIDTWKLLTL